MDNTWYSLFAHDFNLTRRNGIGSSYAEWNWREEKRLSVEAIKELLAKSEISGRDTIH